MITIKCDACGKESVNPYVFSEKCYKFINASHADRSIHLCIGCVKSLNEAVDATRAAFLSESSIYGWREEKGIIV